MFATVITYGKRAVHVEHQIPIPAGWRVVGPDPYNSKPMKKGDKMLVSTPKQLKQEKFIWKLVPRWMVGRKAVITLLVIRKKK
jgi:hypothetical protein